MHGKFVFIDMDSKQVETAGPSGPEQRVERVGKRNAVVQMEIFQRDDYRKKLKDVVEFLKGSVTEFSYDERSVAVLLGGMQQFLESAYGKDALSKPFPKLPSNLFRDIRPGGAVAAIAKVCAGSLKQKKQRRIDWMSPANRKENMELISRVRQELLRGGFMRNPKVYMHPSLRPDSSSRLRNIVVKMGAQLAQSEKESGITHIVFPNSETIAQEDGEEYLRTIEVDGDLARIHWWFLPDSYNEWIPVGSAPGEVDPDEPPPNSRPWQVYERWLVDSEKYNEWMNEGDYETEESAEMNKKLREQQAQGKGAGETGHGDMGEGPQRKKTKKEIRLAEIAAEVAPGAKRVISAGVIEREVVHVNKKAIEGQGPTIDLSHGYRQQWMGPPCTVEAQDTDEKRHVIPFAASWFDMSKLDQIEVREFFEFRKKFSGLWWPEYLTIRNAIISQFRQNPTRKLSFRDVSSNFHMDALIVLKIFKFLEKWGIINYFDLGGTGYHPGKKYDMSHHAGMEALKVRQHPVSMEWALSTWVSGGRSSKSKLRHGTLSRQNILPTGQIIPQEKGVFCAVRPWVDCTSDRYVCKSDESICICPDAFNNGEFPPGTSARDFTRCQNSNTPAATSSGRKPWSPQDDYLLLEAIFKHKENHNNTTLYNWKEIAKAVGGKSEAECVQRFLEFPIEESLIAAALDLEEHFPSLTLGSDGTPSIPERYYRAPINSRDIEGTKDLNPLTSNLIILLNVIGPEIASIAAHQALETVLTSEEAQDGASPDTKEKKRSMRFGVNIDILRKASFEGIKNAAIRAQDLAHEKFQGMQTAILDMADVQLQRLWEKCDYAASLEQVIAEETDMAVAKKSKVKEKLADLDKELSKKIHTDIKEEP